MSEQIDMHEPGDRIFTLGSDGVPHTHIVKTDGTISTPGELKASNTYLRAAALADGLGLAPVDFEIALEAVTDMMHHGMMPDQMQSVALMWTRGELTPLLNKSEADR